MNEKKPGETNETEHTISHGISILYLYILLRYNLEQKRNYFENIVKAGMPEVKNCLGSLREIEKYMVIFENEQIVEIDKELDDQDRIVARKKSEKAAEYYKSHLAQMLEDTIKLFDKESLFAGELSYSHPKGFGIESKTKSMQDLIDTYSRNLKNRFAHVAKGRGERNNWTASKLRLLHNTYYSFYEIIKKARNRYNVLAEAELKGVHRKTEKKGELLNMIKMYFPTIPDYIIEKFVYEDVKDCLLAMEATNEALDLNMKLSSIQTALSKARKFIDQN